jgi:hypothetical protein
MEWHLLDRMATLHVLSLFASDSFRRGGRQKRRRTKIRTNLKRLKVRVVAIRMTQGRRSTAGEGWWILLRNSGGGGSMKGAVRSWQYCNSRYS